MYKKSVLKNGLTVVTCGMPSRRSVSLGIWIKAGGRHETRVNKGISHFLEHMLFKGSSKYSCREIKESIEGQGGSLNGFTSEEVTCYLVKVPAAKMNVGLDILSDMVMRPSLPRSDFSREKAVILEELKMYKDLPQSYVHELLDTLLWPGHPLGMGIIGFEDSLDSLDRDDLRNYRDEHYVPANIVVSAAGGLDHSGFCRLAGRAFSWAGKGKKEPAGYLPVKGPDRPGPAFNLLRKDTEQTHIAMGFRAFHREHKLKYASALLHIILGANMSSRLFHEVREKRGLAYEIGTQLKRFHDTGAFIVHAGIDNGKVSKALEIVVAELRRIKERPVEKKELKRAKDYFLGQLMLALEDSMEQMLFAGEAVTLGEGIRTYEEIAGDVSKVSSSEIKAAAREIFFRDKLRFAAIGAAVDNERQFSRLWPGLD
ncbi:MAG: pitrilysin family protein [Candidatus Omnitrophota bacterium]|jgi:predicted Zn-dependent peptidase